MPEVMTFHPPTKKPAEAGFSKTMTTPCRGIPCLWSIIHDPEHFLCFSG